MIDARALLDTQMPERELQANLRKLAKHLGWFSYHPWSSKHSEEGWPDMVLVHPGHPEWPVIIAELKTMTGEMSAAQRAWLETLDGREIVTRLWRPDAWSSGEIDDALRGNP